MNIPKKKRESGKQTSVKVGNVSDISGNVNVACENITTQQTTTGLSAAEINQLFNQPFTAIETRAEKRKSEEGF